MRRALRRLYARSPLALVGAFIVGVSEHARRSQTSYIGPWWERRDRAHTAGSEFARRLTRAGEVR